MDWNRGPVSYFITVHVFMDSGSVTQQGVKLPGGMGGGFESEGESHL